MEIITRNDYRVLIKDGKMITDDSPERYAENKLLKQEMSGEVLLCGLGLGILPLTLQDKKEITKIDVVEIEKEFIEASPKFSDKVSVIHSDIFDFKGEYDYIYIDIWLSTEGKEKEIKLLKANLTARKEMIFYGEERWGGVWADKRISETILKEQERHE